MEYVIKEKPSIIQQIVIYNKPNIKHNNTGISTSKGDIIISNRSTIGDDAQIKKEQEELEDDFYYEGTDAVDSNKVTECTDIITSGNDEQAELSVPETTDDSVDNINSANFSPAPVTSTPFKKPRGRPKKTIVTPKFVNTLDKYLITESQTAVNIQKRPRGRPKKLGQDSSVTTEEKPKKRGRKRKIEQTSDSANEKGSHIDNLNRVEEELQDMFNEGDKDGDDNDESSCVEEYEDSDEDSRQEWMPEEYVEYKQQHLMKMNKRTKFPCKYCNKEFPTSYAMRKHKAIEHNDAGTPRKQATMDNSVGSEHDGSSDVDNGTDTESLVEWMPDDYAEYKMKHSVDKMRRSQWFKCKICCAVFSSYYHLSKHKVEHQTKENPYECHQCPEQFKDVESLMVHIRIHQGKDPYQCKKCDKGFNTKAELDEHFMIHILKKKPLPKRYKCNVCSKEFGKLCDVERHTRVHTGEKPWKCKICLKDFQQSHNLSKHLLIHLHVKPFQCEICNKKFGRVDVLNRHLLTHSMEKPFKCKECKKGFIREVQLNKHIEKHHEKQAQEQEQEPEDS